MGSVIEIVQPTGFITCPECHGEGRVPRDLREREERQRKLAIRARKIESVTEMAYQILDYSIFFIGGLSLPILGSLLLGFLGGIWSWVTGEFTSPPQMEGLLYVMHIAGACLGGVAILVWVIASVDSNHILDRPFWSPSGRRARREKARGTKANK